MKQQCADCVIMGSVLGGAGDAFRCGYCAVGLVRRQSSMACRKGHGQLACAHSVQCGTHENGQLVACIGHLYAHAACEMCVQFAYVASRPSRAIGLALPLVRADRRDCGRVPRASCCTGAVERTVMLSRPACVDRGISCVGPVGRGRRASACVEGPVRGRGPRSTDDRDETPDARI